MKLSQIQQSKSILPDSGCDGRDSWGIFLSLEQPDHAIKIFYDEQQFNDEKIGYDKVLGDPNLKRFANQYNEISLEIDTSTYLNNRKDPPFGLALQIPFLSDPPWKNIGKLGTEETDSALVKLNLNIEQIKDSFCRLGIASWETTFFVNFISRDIKAIDFTYSNVVFNSNAATEE